MVHLLCHVIYQSPLHKNQPRMIRAGNFLTLPREGSRPSTALAEAEVVDPISFAGVGDASGFEYVVSEKIQGRWYHRMQRCRRGVDVDHLWVFSKNLDELDS